MRDGWTPDRRRADRRRLSVPLTATDLRTGAAWKVVDIGPLGTVVETLQPLALDTAVTLQFGSADGSLGPFDARVAHCRLLLGTSRGPGTTYLVGLSFAPMADDVRAPLTAFLSRMGVALRHDSQDES